MAEGTGPLGTIKPIWRRPLLLYYWVPPVLWGLAVVLVSGGLGSGKNTLGLLKWLLPWFVALKPAQLNKINLYTRKIGHVLAYGWMYFLWFRAFRWHASLEPWRAFLWSLGFCLGFAAVDEGRQWFHVSRGGSVYDVMLDMSASVLAALIIAVVWRPRNQVGSSPERSRWSPHLLSYWLPPFVWSLAVLALSADGLLIQSTLGPLKWSVSWFAVVSTYDLKILNLFMWKIGRVLAFGILYLLWVRAFQGDAGASRGRACGYSLGLCLLHAMMGTTYRILNGIQMGNLWEVVLDLSPPVLAALVIALIWTPRRHTLAIPGLAGRQPRPPE